MITTLEGWKGIEYKFGKDNDVTLLFDRKSDTSKYQESS